MKLSRILVVDDEPQARRVLRIALVAQGFEVNDARSGEEALEKLHEESPDLILLDLKMPGIGGLQACPGNTHLFGGADHCSLRKEIAAGPGGGIRSWRRPVHHQTFRHRRTSRLHPRRKSPRQQRSFANSRIGRREIHFETHEVERQDGVVHLTAKEFKLLYCLASHPGEVLSHRRILQAVWGPDYGDEVEYLRVFINQLRKKIESDPANPAFILTDPSAGYRLSISPRLVPAARNATRVRAAPTKTRVNPAIAGSS